ncbi:hypothetical protein EFR50_09675, partial [Lactobacillus delbrueckii subsp. lactis]|nr:hypothetical protein [Lactobacillus delbrueckii subsp. lactis]
LTPNLTAFTGVDSQNLPDVMVSVQFILAIGDTNLFDDEAESFTIKDYWSYFDKSDQTWLVIYVSSLFVPFISAKLTGLPPYPTFAELDQLFPF